MADENIEDAQIVNEDGKVESIKTTYINLINGKSFAVAMTAASIVNHIAYNNPRVVSLVRTDGPDLHILVQNIAYIEEIESTL